MGIKQKNRHRKKLTKEYRKELFKNDNDRILKILEEIINEPAFSNIRLAALAKKISTNHRAILKLYSAKNLQLSLSSYLDTNLINLLSGRVKSQPIPITPNPSKFKRGKRNGSIARATFVRG